MVGGRDKGWSVSTPTFIIRYPRLLAKGPPVFSFSLSIRSRSYGDLGQERTTGVWTYPPPHPVFSRYRSSNTCPIFPQNRTHPTHSYLLALPSLSQAAAHTFLGPFGGLASLLFILAFSFSLSFSAPPLLPMVRSTLPGTLSCTLYLPKDRSHTHTRTHTHAHTHTRRHTHSHTHPPTHHPKVIQARLPQVLLLLLLLLQLLSTRHADVHCYQTPATLLLVLFLLLLLF
ncbi:hypothetical protein LZ31DRAFT_270712 [Colletotrichum somersetense]|nr:hypothetical protein LZ31DRAFT_270712 [Colletotrichum somersetense]